MFQKSLMKLSLRQWKKEDIVDKMNKVAIDTTNTNTNKEETPITEITRCPIKPIKYKL